MWSPFPLSTSPGFVVGTVSHVAQADLELIVALLPEPSECWNYKYVVEAGHQLFFKDVSLYVPLAVLELSM